MIDLVAASIILGLLVFMIVGYAVRTYVVGRLHDQRLDRAEGKLLGRDLMEAGYWLMGPVVNLLHAMGATPNMVTLASLVPALGSAWAMATGHFGVAGFLGVTVAVCDVLDGILARRLGISSDAGEVIDAAVDRYTEYLLLAGLAVYCRDKWPLMVMVLAALLGSLMISYSTAKAEAMGLPVPKGIMRRPERAFFVNGGAVFVPPIALLLPAHLAARREIHDLPLMLSVGVMAVLTNLSAVARFVEIVRSARQRTAATRAAAPTSFTSEQPAVPGSAQGSARAV